MSALKTAPTKEGKAPQYTLRPCGVVRCSDDGKVRLKVADGTGYVEGVVHCGSVHGCPVCAAVIRLGSTSFAHMERETSRARMIDVRPVGTLWVSCAV